MIFSTQTHFLADKFGLVEACERLALAGFPAIDISMFHVDQPPFTDDYKEVAEKLLEISKRTGVKYVQAHAPFGGGREKYTQNLVPLMPRAFEFCGLLGIENIVVHPIQDGRFYGREKEIFDLNIEFYKSLAPIAKKHGVKIAIENMWQRHARAKYIIDDIIADPLELARMYDTLADPEAFTVCLDIGHVALCQREPEDAIRVIGGERLGALHVHDVDYIDDLHTMPGCGKINWDAVCRALAEVGYQGSFNLEADNFYRNYLPEHIELCTKFMADSTKIFADKVDEFRAK